MSHGRSNAVGDTEQPTVSTRYLVSVYTLNRECRPEVNAITCIMLFKGSLCDEDLRAFIEEHIATAAAPELDLRGEEELMHTINFATLTTLLGGATRLPALCDQMRSFTIGPAASRFERPLLDGAGYTVGFLSLEPGQWQHTNDVARRLCERIQRDTEEARRVVD
jgi:hypothetical protein